jgi:hypothetical protein
MGWDYFLVGKLHSGYQLINHASGLRKGLELKISAQVLICQILMLRHVVPTIAEREGNKKEAAWCETVFSHHGCGSK